MAKTTVDIRDLGKLRQQIWSWRGSGDRIGFVPTMGALHDGHLSLVRLAQKDADRVVVSIFVNPAQFAPNEDLASYPRTEAADIARLQSVGCDVIYMPATENMYDENHKTNIDVGGVAKGLESDFRPTFFNGVALIVSKLFNQVEPDLAVFGEKDYQQLAVIRQVTRDLDFPVRIVGAPIIRDGYGLALSSRNSYFDEDGLKIARQLNVIMQACAAALKAGDKVEQATTQARSALISAGFSAVDYVAVADPDTLALQTSGKVTKPMRLLIAAHSEGVRLIDNCAV